MNTALGIGFATTGATLFVAVGLFVWDRVLTHIRDRQEVRRLLVVRVLDAFDGSTRSMLRPAFVQAWTNGDLEYALLMPRLLLDLNGRERVIAVWLQRQVQLMMLAVSKKDRIIVRANVAERLIEWHAGAVKVSWFEKQVRLDPIAVGFRIPVSIRLRQLGRDSSNWAQVFGVIAGLAVVVRQAIAK